MPIHDSHFYPFFVAESSPMIRQKMDHANWHLVHTGGGRRTVEERRSLARFSLRMPARVVSPSSGTQPLEIHTRDVSADGAFLSTGEPIAEGTAVTLELELPVEKFRQLLQQQDHDVKLRIKGVVIRAEPGGVAVRFRKKYEIIALGIKR
jgi:hypothetical protein